MVANNRFLTFVLCGEYGVVIILLYWVVGNGGWWYVLVMVVGGSGDGGVLRVFCSSWRAILPLAVINGTNSIN